MNKYSPPPGGGFGRRQAEPPPMDEYYGMSEAAKRFLQEERTRRQQERDVDAVYTIHGQSAQYIEFTLESGQTMCVPDGSVIWKDDAIEVSGDGPIVGDGGIVGAGRRLLLGEGLTLVTLTNLSGKAAMVAVSGKIASTITAIPIAEEHPGIVCACDNFVAASHGIMVMAGSHRGLIDQFLGDGTPMLCELSGKGVVFIQGGGQLIERQIERGDTICVDPDCVAAYDMTITVREQVQPLPGLAISERPRELDTQFLAPVMGPGKIWLQTVPLWRVTGQSGASDGEFRVGVGLNERVGVSVGLSDAVGLLDKIF